MSEIVVRPPGYVTEDAVGLRETHGASGLVLNFTARSTDCIALLGGEGGRYTTGTCSSPHSCTKEPIKV